MAEPITNPLTEAEKRAGQQAVVTPVTMETDSTELLTSDMGQLPATPVISTSTTDTTNLSVTAPTAPSQLGQVAKTETTQEDLGTITAATGQVSREITADDMTGVVSEDALATAVTEELDPRATTRYQLSELYKSIEEGKPLPAWASPAVRRVSAIMQQRGMGASSMAAAAMTQAIMESGVSIAQQDAQKYAQIQLNNINNKQKVALQNALTTAQMDQTNANNRMKGAIANAQAFLQMDVANLNTQQKANELNFQAGIQALFTDTAAQNATAQLNAKTSLQVEEFYAELGSQVEAANANRMSAVNQFNTSQENAMQQFKTQVGDARDKFNANMKFAVDQSNAQWRRQINTANTTLQNETNRINTQNLYNASQTAMNFLWQKMRDNATFNFQKSENFLQKQHEIGLLAMEFANSEKLYDQQQRDLVGVKIGEWLGNWIVSASEGD